MAVLAAAHCLEITELCEICIEFVGASLDPDNFLEYFRFAREWNTGCKWAKKLEVLTWTFLCRTAGSEMRAHLPELPLDVLERLFSADELWVQTEADRFDLVVDSLAPKLDEYRGDLVQAVVTDVLHDLLAEIERNTEWSWQDVWGTQSSLSPRLEADSDERHDWGTKGQKRIRTDGITQPWHKKSRIEQGELMTRSSCCRTVNPNLGAEAWNLVDIHSAFCDDPSGLFRAASIGRSGLTGWDVAGGRGRFSRLSESCAKALDGAGTVESMLYRVLGQQGCVSYSAMGFGDLLRVK